MYIDLLLDIMVSSFKKNVMDRLVIRNGIYKVIPCFADEFQGCIQKWEFSKANKKKESQTMRTFHQTEKGQNTNKKLSKKSAKKAAKKKRQTAKELLKRKFSHSPKKKSA